MRELATLRLSLQRATDYTVQSVALAERAGRPMGDLPALTNRLTRLGSSLDEHLRWLEREPDPQRLQTLLPAARERTKEVTGAASRIRSTLGQFEAAENDADVESLTADVSSEVAALQAGIESMRGTGDTGSGQGTALPS